MGKLKPATVHQEFRILKRILDVAVKKKCLDANPCSAVEFPIQLRNATRKPHYMTASEQQRIEFSAPDYLRNAIVILAETGLRPYKELMPMKKLQLDMEKPGGLYPGLQDSKRGRRDADSGFGLQGVPSADRSDASKRVSVPDATPTIQQAIHQITEEDLGPRHCGVLACHISRYTSCAIPLLPDSAPGESRTILSPKCFGRETRRYSSGTARRS